MNNIKSNNISDILDGRDIVHGQVVLVLSNEVYCSILL
jgi:hypothetical protein